MLENQETSRLNMIFLNLIITCDVSWSFITSLVFVHQAITKTMKIIERQSIQDIGSKPGQNPSKGKTQKKSFSSYRISLQLDFKDVNTKAQNSPKHQVNPPARSLQGSFKTSTFCIFTLQFRPATAPQNFSLLQLETSQKP